MSTHECMLKSQLTHTHTQMHTHTRTCTCIHTHARTHKAKPVAAMQYSHAYLGSLCTKQALQSQYRQILLGTELAPCRRAPHASWMMMWAPKVTPESQPLGQGIGYWMQCFLCLLEISSLFPVAPQCWQWHAWTFFGEMQLYTLSFQLQTTLTQ